MEPTTGRPDADAAGFLEFLERCHDALRQHTGGNPRQVLAPCRGRAGDQPAAGGMTRSWPAFPEIKAVGGYATSWATVVKRA